MAIQAKNIEDQVKKLSKSSAKLHRSDFSSLNAYSFKNMAKYIASLREKGIINDDGYADLLLYACSIFIENEVVERVERVLANKLPVFSYSER